jgi:hypothetical protein
MPRTAISGVTFLMLLGFSAVSQESGAKAPTVTRGN